MVEYKQEENKKKAVKSSISDEAVKVDEPVKVGSDPTRAPKKVTKPTKPFNGGSENEGYYSLGDGTVGTGQDLRRTKEGQANLKKGQAMIKDQLDGSMADKLRTGSFLNDVYRPKIAEEIARRNTGKEIQPVENPAPSKAMTMDVETIANTYDSGNLSAIDLENLRTQDPQKYQEAKLALDRKRTLDAINQNSDDYISTYKQMADSYMKRWEEIASSDEGKTLREEVFAKYGLNDSNDRIQKYTTQIDEVEEELDNLINKTGTGDAIADRAEMFRKQRELTKKRNDLVKARSSELDYYRLGLEQADAVVEDYKAYQKEELDMMSKQFELTTGMSYMEFSAEQEKLGRELSDIDGYLASIAKSKEDELAYMRELEKEDRQFERDLFRDDLQFERDLTKAMTMAEVDFGYDVQLQNLSLQNQITLSQVDAQTKLGLLRATKELDMMYPEYDLSELEIDGQKQKVAVNKYDPTDYKIINPAIGKDYLSSLGSGTITSWGGKHDNYQGVDIDGKIGDPITTKGGTIVKVVSGQGKSDTPSYGNYVDVQDENGYIHRYAHLNAVNVEEGMSVPEGFIIGELGNTGYTIAGAGGDGSHLDYSVKRPDGQFMKSTEIPGYLSTLQKETPISPEMKEIFQLLDLLKKESLVTGEKNKGFGQAVGDSRQKGLSGKIRKTITGESEEGLVIGTDASSFASRINSLTSIFALANTDKLTGQMSDNDIILLKRASTTLNKDMSEDEFLKEIARVENKLLAELGATLPQVLPIPDFDGKEELVPSTYLPTL